MTRAPRPKEKPRVGIVCIVAGQKFLPLPRLTPRFFRSRSHRSPAGEILSGWPSLLSQLARKNYYALPMLLPVTCLLSSLRRRQIERKRKRERERERENAQRFCFFPRPACAQPTASFSSDLRFLQRTGERHYGKRYCLHPVVCESYSPLVETRLICLKNYDCGLGYSLGTAELAGRSCFSRYLRCFLSKDSSTY